MNKPFLFAIFLFFLLVGMHHVQAQKPTKNYSYKILPSKNNTFGYDILDNGKLIIHQTSIPGKPGELGFSTSKQAETVAKFAINKMNNNIFPPTITAVELDSLTKIKK